jgi:hypothetical protein
MFTIDEAREFLNKAGIFFGRDEDDSESDIRWDQTINLNDAFYWACADGEYVDDNELPRLAGLFWRYGYAGVSYWVLVEKRGGEIPEFLDVKRQVEFVKNEESIIKEEPSCSKRAYLKRQYTIGESE